MDITQEIFDTLIAGGKTPETARSLLVSRLGEDEANRAYLEHERRAGRIFQLRDPPIIAPPGKRAWYTGPSDADRFWPRLKRYLEDKGWDEAVIDSIDQASSKILAHMEPSASETIDTRGLVVGYVQSGKTANFTALVAKAADVGYRLFIVLAGVHNSLRRQTQRRLNRELCELDKEHWIKLTKADEDFRTSENTDAFLSQKSTSKILCVVKKNHAVLNRLKRWLAAGSDEVLSRCPVLIIDDEADQAGLNAARDPEVRTVTNRLILEIMGSLPKAAYVGYTATPFANVLVDPSGGDLYPKDFIVELPKPMGYFGAERLFGRLGIPRDDDDAEEAAEFDMIRTIPEEQIPQVRPRGARNAPDFSPELAESLRAALRYFAMATAARRARGQHGHSSMLVHTTLLTDPHEKLGAIVKEAWDSLTHDFDAGDEQLIEELSSQWASETESVPAESLGLDPVTFEDLRPQLAGVLTDGRVVIENSGSLERLSYEGAPQVQIAVGGNTLSRGLTLEGLVTSYFVRSASAYDTLLQMGRWFGYRLGYEDLPRVWMTTDLQESFRQLATVEEEIRRDIRRYEGGASPLDIAVRIRTHPSLAVTAALKMRHAVDCEISYGGGTRQTTVFDVEDVDLLQNNLAAADTLVRSLGKPDVEQSNGRVVWRNVPVATVLRFVDDYRFAAGPGELATDPLRGYIDAQREKGSLARWTVVLAGVRNAKRGTREIGGRSVNLLNRSRLGGRTSNNAAIGTVTTQGDIRLDLPADQKQRLENDPPALLVYPIAKDSSPPERFKSSKRRIDLDAKDDVIAVAFDFPPTNHPTPQKYVQVDLPLADPIDEEARFDADADEG